jgi:hypothetical protein
MHQRELARAGRQPVLHVSSPAGPSYRVDPARGTVAVTVAGGPVYPGIRDDEAETVVMPRVRRRAGGLEDPD